MKRNTIGRTALATIVSLATGLGITACSRDYTVAYVYAISASGGGISAFNVDYQTGSLTQVAGSPFTSQLTNPVSIITAPNGQFIYAIGGSQDNEVTELAVGTDGKLYGQHQYNITGTYPTAAAIDAAGKFLYVTFTYQTGYTPANPGPGGITIFPINSDNSLGTPITQNVGLNPVGVATSALSSFVYVIDADTNTSGNATGQLLGFAENASTGALTPVSGTTITTSGGRTVATGFAAGNVPSGVVEDPTSRFVYVTDKATNQLYGYTVNGGSTVGGLTPMVNGPFLTGFFPVAVTIEPRGKYLYTANYGASTVGTYAIDPATGNPAGVAAVSNFSVATGPTCVSVEPALGVYLYTSNYLDNSVSGAKLDSHNGALAAVENTAFSAGTHLSCITTVANGAHASSLVNP